MAYVCLNRSSWFKFQVRTFFYCKNNVHVTDAPIFLHNGEHMHKQLRVIYGHFNCLCTFYVCRKKSDTQNYVCIHQRVFLNKVKLESALEGVLQGKELIFVHDMRNGPNKHFFGAYADISFRNYLHWRPVPTE